ncbi:uncharacterized protein LOC112272390 [Brachypodium distachyon]|uniref:uncharacterized protein LOC112272390 n=1 Tax=Brachypodium distachyon TaxID=15368 RepID=UPI000D0DD27F|nr:uncharacterized protein LOC112272390 [Brachypodium distachyon]|eukprot:XP_024318805.1 uncharacterized protein LOC112272390 [Brachypodium distachyon]
METMDEHPPPNQSVGVGADDSQPPQGGNNPPESMEQHPRPNQSRGTADNQHRQEKREHPPAKKSRSDLLLPHGRPASVPDLQAQLGAVQEKMADLEMKMQRDREERAAEREYNAALRGWLQNYVDTFHLKQNLQMVSPQFPILKPPPLPRMPPPRGPSTPGSAASNQSEAAGTLASQGLVTSRNGGASTSRQ